MKYPRISRWTLPALIVSISVVILVTTALAQKFEVKTVEGHTSPLIATITYPDGEKRTVMVLGIGGVGQERFLTHQIKLKGKADADVTFWLDSIATIKETTDRAAVFVLKDGTEREMGYAGYLYNPGALGRILFIRGDDDGTEQIDMQKIDSVEFLRPARKDKEGNAMFDLWKYSPYTGEELPRMKMEEVPSPELKRQEYDT